MTGNRGRSLGDWSRATLSDSLALRRWRAERQTFTYEKVESTMRTRRWFLALPLAFAATLSAGHAASVRDKAGLFSADAVRQAESELSRLEQNDQISTTIETIDSLNGQSITEAARRLAQETGATGLFVLIAKKESKIDAISQQSFRRAVNEPRLRAIQNAFLADFKKRDFDAGLLSGVRTIKAEIDSAKSEFGTLRQGAGAAAPRVGRGGGGGGGGMRRGNPNGGFGVSSLLFIGAIILGVLFFVRILGRLFGGGQANPMMGGRMGAPGYGGGGGGGGFMSSLFGGLGGAMAGNWLYDQFSGRHGGGGYGDNSSSGDSGADAGGSDWAGGGDAGGADWGGGGGDAGGGDWGGGGGGGDGGGGW